MCDGERGGVCDGRERVEEREEGCVMGEREEGCVMGEREEGCVMGEREEGCAMERERGLRRERRGV